MSGTTPAKSWKSQRRAQRGVYPREMDVRAVEDSQPANKSEMVVAERKEVTAVRSRDVM
jgi:hypothetical protein